MPSKIILLSIFCFSVFMPSLYGAKATEESISRVNKINAIIKKYREAGEKLSDQDVKDSIMKEVAEIIPLVPESEARSMNMDAIKSKVMEKIAVRFPEKHDALKKKITDEADKVFQMSTVMDFVSVKYHKGDKIYTAEGLFYGVKPERNGVKIGETTYSIVDLAPEDRVKFDKTYNELKKKQYMDQKIEKYYQKKQEYTAEIRQQIVDQVNTENEKAGYIFAWDKWRTAKNVTEMLIDEIMKSQEAIVAKTAESESKKPEIAEAKPTTTPEGKAGDDLEKRRAELKKKVDIELMRITNTYSGIDADQGYKEAIWWMKGEDINLLFPENFRPEDKSNPKILNNPNPVVSSIELHFFNDYLFKVVTNYKIASSPEAMIELAKKIRDDYGPSDEEKEAENEEASAEAAEQPPAEPAPADPANPEPPPEIPLEETYTWKGKITKGSLYICRTQDRSSLSKFTLTKENPEVVEQINDALEKEKKRKEEEDRKKEIEKYKQFRDNKM